MSKNFSGTMVGNLKYVKKGEDADIESICNTLEYYFKNCLKLSENSELAKKIFENFGNISKILRLVSKIKDCQKNNDIVKLSRLIGILAGQSGRSLMESTRNLAFAGGNLIEKIEEGLKKGKQIEKFEGNIKEIYSKAGVKFEGEKSIKKFSENWESFQRILKNVSKNMDEDSNAISNIICDLNELQKKYSDSSEKKLSEKINIDVLNEFRSLISDAKMNRLIKKSTYSEGIKIIEKDSFDKQDFKEYIEKFLKEIEETFKASVNDGEKYAEQFNEKLRKNNEIKKLDVKFKKIDLKKIKNRKYIKKVLDNIDADYPKVSKKSLDKKEKFASELNKNIGELKTKFKFIEGQKIFISTAKNRTSSILLRLFNRDNKLIKFIKSKILLK